MLGFEVVGIVGAALTGGRAWLTEVVDTGTTGLGGTTTVLLLASSAGALQTLDPKAGTAAGGDEARGAYLSLDASARLARRASSFPGSRRSSFAAMGSIASEERREYESTCGPSRSDGDV
jgi:hypothetical protein